MLQFGSKHVGIEDVLIFKHCHEVTGLLLWIGTYCISCVVQQISRVKDLSSLVRYDDSCLLTAIRHVQSIIWVVRLRPNIRSHSVLFSLQNLNLSSLYPKSHDESWSLQGKLQRPLKKRGSNSSRSTLVTLSLSFVIQWVTTVDPILLRFCWCPALTINRVLIAAEIQGFAAYFLRLRAWSQ